MRRIGTFFVVIAILLAGMVTLQPVVSAQDDQAQLEANKTVVRRYFEEALTQNKPELVDELFDPSYVLHANTGDLQGLDNTRSFITTIKTAFPDATWTIRDLIAEGPYVAARTSVSGTQEAPFLGLPSSGGTISNVPGMSMFRIENGKIVESWSEDNFLILGQQLGTAPAPFGIPVFTEFGQPVGPQTDHATRDANKAIVTRLLDEGWTQGNLAIIDELYAPDAINHPTAAAQGPEVAGIALQISILRAGMPDVKVTPDIMIAEGDEVATRFTISGNDTGGMFGFPPSGKALTTGGLRIDRIRDGKIVETWLIVDILKIFQDIGAIPVATPAAT